MNRSIDNSQNIMDSRDIRREAEAIESERQDLLDTIEAAKQAIEDEVDDCGEQEREEHLQELEAAEAALKEFDEDTDKKAIVAFNEEGNDNAGDWFHGETVIRGSYFEDYCKDLVSDIGDMPKDIPHYIVIDWEATADNIRQDYSTIDFDGVEYLVRS